MLNDISRRRFQNTIPNRKQPGDVGFPEGKNKQRKKDYFNNTNADVHGQPAAVEQKIFKTKGNQYQA